MPSLMPCVAGAKEVYGIVLIRDDYSITITDKALKRYNMKDNDIILMITGKANEPSFGLIRRQVAIKSTTTTIGHVLIDIFKKDCLIRVFIKL